MAFGLGAFLAAAPLMAANPSPADAKPDLAAAVKEKAADVIEQGKQGADAKADSLQKTLKMDTVNEKGETNAVEKVKQKIDDKATDLEKKLGVDKVKDAEGAGAEKVDAVRDGAASATEEKKNAVDALKGLKDKAPKPQ